MLAAAVTFVTYRLYGAGNRKRVKARILLLRYSGLPSCKGGGVRKAIASDRNSPFNSENIEPIHFLRSRFHSRSVTSEGSNPRTYAKSR